MRAPDGPLHRVTGTYREVDPPNRLVYTWQWETTPGATETLVTVEFHDRAGRTEVVLTHERLPDAEARARHRSEEHTSELQSLAYLVCRLLLEKKKQGYAHSAS